MKGNNPGVPYGKRDVPVGFRENFISLKFSWVVNDFRSTYEVSVQSEMGLVMEETGLCNK